MNMLQILLLALAFFGGYKLSKARKAGKARKEKQEKPEKKEPSRQEIIDSVYRRLLLENGEVVQQPRKVTKLTPEAIEQMVAEAEIDQEETNEE